MPVDSEFIAVSVGPGCPGESVRYDELEFKIDAAGNVTGSGRGAERPTGCSRPLGGPAGIVIDDLRTE